MIDFKTAKLIFARYIYKGKDVNEAALKVYNGDKNLASKLKKCLNDPEVLAYINKLKDEDIKKDGMRQLDSKTDLLLKLKGMYDNILVMPKDRVAAIKLSAEINGFLNNDLNPNLSVNKVMLVGSIDNWEDEIKKQQEGLRDV